MSKIAGDEPQHWHRDDGNGRLRHNMPDPRKFGISPVHWSDDDKAYAAHLTRHEELAASLTALPDDDPFVRAVLNFAANEAAVVERVRALAVLLRSELAEGTPLKHAKSAFALAQMLPHLFRGESDNSVDPGEKP
jgi:hypothetical protein